MRAYGISGGVGQAYEITIGIRNSLPKVISWDRIPTAGHSRLLEAIFERNDHDHGVGRRYDRNIRSGRLKSSRAINDRQLFGGHRWGDKIMSKERGPSLHVEWSPDRVRAIDIATGRRYAGATLSALSPLPAGQRTVIVGISRQLVFMKCVSLPKAAPEDLRRVLGVQMAQLFPLPPDQLAFDFIQTNEHLADGFLTLVAAVRSEGSTPAQQ